MNPADVLRTVVTALDDAGIPHMLVGSFASSAHGASRTTNDIDLVIDPTPESLDMLTSILQDADMYVSPSAQEALVNRDQFNVISATTGWKIDLIIRKERAFSRSEFSRRIPATLHGVPLWLASPEDTVLAKLEWAYLGSSDRQVADASGILDVHANDLDIDYLRKWATELNIVDMLEHALAEISPAD